MTRFVIAVLTALAAPWLVASADAREMRLTIYGDGHSCPGNCDAHVVFNSADNGTRFAFRPSSSRAQPKRCVVGEPCRICFGEADASCMTVRYRGGGPRVGTFDFTPAFYQSTCGTAGIPAALADKCRALDRAVSDGRYDVRIDCISEPSHALCISVIAAARAAKAADRPKRDACREVGNEAYNETQANDADKRSEGCEYTFLRTGGPNSQGNRWRRLQPAACGNGTFVGRDGLDCCSADRRFAASIHPECAPFFPLPP